MDVFSSLIERQADPFNAEPALETLVASYITPINSFYVRTHGSVPAIDSDALRLRIGGLIREPVEVSLADLRSRFTPRRVVASLQCAGNRRREFNEIDRISGLAWDAGAIGTAVWTGVSLGEVLAELGCAGGDLHVSFDSCDEIEQAGRRFAYGVSIPLAKACSDTLLVYGMNGEDLPIGHGGPLRAIVPGYYGVRSVKWLTAITVQNEPSTNFFQRVDYKVYPANADPRQLEGSTGITLNEIAINAAIASPADGAEVPSGGCTVRGYVMVGDRRAERVELSIDGGATWCVAELDPGDRWSWRLWRARVDLAPGKHAISVRAWDSAAQTTPADARDLWNPKGYANTAWHRIGLTAR